MAPQSGTIWTIRKLGHRRLRQNYVQTRTANTDDAGVILKQHGETTRAVGLVYVGLMGLILFAVPRLKPANNRESKRPDNTFLS